MKKNNEYGDEYVEIADKIKEDARNIDIPEKMSDEELNNSIRRNLEKSADISKIQHELKKESKLVKLIKSRKVQAIAACILVLILIGVGTGIEEKTRNLEKSKVAEITTTKGSEEQKIKEPKDYSEIYERLASAPNHSNTTNDLIMEDTMMENSASVNKESSRDSDSKQSGNDYYDTNEQTENVHEGDIVKTDGEYIYTLTGKVTKNKQSYYINISKADGKKVSQISKTELSMSKDNEDMYYDYSELYVYKDKLIAIGTEREYAKETKNRLVEDSYSYYSPNATTIIRVYDISNRTKPKKVSQFTQEGTFNDSRMTEGVLYTISNVTLYDFSKDKCVPYVNGELIDSSRVFVPETVESPSYVTITSLDIENPHKFLDSQAVVSENPIIYVSKNSIYLADTKFERKDISDTKEGKKYLKEKKYKRILNKWKYRKQIRSNGYAMSEITLKNETVVFESKCNTDIIKINYKYGKIKVDTNKTIEGYIEDSLSLHEEDGYLRMVANITKTIWLESGIVFYNKDGEIVDTHPDDYKNLKEEVYNNFYMLDNKLNISGELTKLGKNETIYAARFIGDIGYFVTYENKDPLFAVNVSNPKKPKIIGELKITGFSDYLHFYNDTLLFGFGMESNPDTGENTGLKLEMYDISKGEAKVRHKLVDKNIDYSEALHNYNSIMVSPEMNLIGFSAQRYDEYDNSYEIYKYNKNKGFVKKSSIKISGYSTIRGLFINNFIYVVSPDEGITVINMSNYKKVGELNF